MASPPAAGSGSPSVEVPVAPEQPEVAVDPSPTGSGAQQLAVVHANCIVAIRALSAHYARSGVSLPLALRVEGEKLLGSFISPGGRRAQLRGLATLAGTQSVLSASQASPSSNPSTPVGSPLGSPDKEGARRKSSKTKRKLPLAEASRSTPISKKSSLTASRPVTRDLPYSLLLSEHAGVVPTQWQNAGYKTFEYAEEDFQQYLEWRANKDSRAASLEARLVLAGFLSADPVNRSIPLLRPTPFMPGAQLSTSQVDAALSADPASSSALATGPAAPAHISAATPETVLNKTP